MTLSPQPETVSPQPETAAGNRLALRLSEKPFEFDFFQAVRLLERFSHRKPVGRFVNPLLEAVHFAAHPSTVFPASDVQELEARPGLPPLLVVNFMGLVGPASVMPLTYTALVRDRSRAGDTALRDFLDIFHHRMISLFYAAWEKYRFTVAYERGERDHLTRHLLDLVGLGTSGLQDRQPVDDESLLYYAGLLAQRPRSALALKQLLEDYFDVPVTILQFAGAWYPLNPETRCCLQEGRGESSRLGIGAVIGNVIWDQQSAVRIRLGPLTLEQYLDFLPTGTAYRPLRAITRFFSGDALNFEAQLVLRREEAPRCELGRKDTRAPRLGWISWSRSKPLDRNPDETVLRLRGK